MCSETYKTSQGISRLGGFFREIITFVTFFCPNSTFYHVIYHFCLEIIAFIIEQGFVIILYKILSFISQKF